MDHPQNLEKKQKLLPNDFLYAICHELKTPLNALISFSQALQEEISNPNSIKDCTDYAREINLAALDLNELIHDLLDVGQSSSGNFSVNLGDKIDIKEIIKRSIRLNYDYSLRRRVSLKAEIVDDIGLINLDEKRVKQVLVNLISNAIKYSRENSEVKIIAKKVNKNNKDYLEIIISDQGFGMSEEDIASAFQKYRTIENPNSNQVDSFGLGLPITKQLVELQNGRIEIKSKLAVGTEVFLEFSY